MRHNHTRLWRERYGALVNGAPSVICGACGARLEGDGPAVEICCLLCWKNSSKEYYKWLSADERPKEGSLDEDFHKTEWIEANIFG